MRQGGAILASASSEEGREDDRSNGFHAEAGAEPKFTTVHRGRVLVVEDDYFVALTIEDILDKAGYAVLGPVPTAEEAISLAVEERPVLVLMDIRLAGEMDGVDAAIELAAQGIRCIFVTAHSDPGTKQRGEKASPYGWVEKPFSTAQLLNAISAALSSR